MTINIETPYLDIDANILASFLSSFADDTRLSKGISGVTEASALQTDLEAVYRWAEENNMSFNNLKFELLRYGLDSVLKLSTSHRCVFIYTSMQQATLALVEASSTLKTTSKILV